MFVVHTIFYPMTQYQIYPMTLCHFYPNAIETIEQDKNLLEREDWERFT